jgi:hypothetical protein
MMADRREAIVANDPSHNLRRKPVLSENALLEEIIRLTEELGKLPTESELSAFGQFSPKPHRTRWGSFSKAVQAACEKYGVPFGTTVATPSAIKSESTQVSASYAPPSLSFSPKIYAQRKRTQYGEPVDFRGLRHAPVNEQGVVYLFGMVSRELGFLVESIRTAYPDCEGKRCIDAKRQIWENVLIEFEYRSSNFREHGHNVQDCDLIVCWIHD